MPLLYICGDSVMNVQRLKVSCPLVRVLRPTGICLERSLTLTTDYKLTIYISRLTENKVVIMQF